MDRVTEQWGEKHVLGARTLKAPFLQVVCEH